MLRCVRLTTEEKIMFWQKLWYNHWRKITTVALAVAALAATALILVFFPPALPFIAGLAAFAGSLLTMAAPLAIALVSTTVAVGTLLLTTAFHKITDLISEVTSYVNFTPSAAYFDIVPENLGSYSEKSLRYGKLGTLAASVGVGAVAAIGTGLVGGLFFGMAVLSAPVWIVVAAAFGIGMVTSGAVHALDYGSNRYENHSRNELDMIASLQGFPSPQTGNWLESKSSGCFSFAGICKKLSNPFQSRYKTQAIDSEKQANIMPQEGEDEIVSPPIYAKAPRPSKAGMFCARICRSLRPFSPGPSASPFPGSGPVDL